MTRRKSIAAERRSYRLRGSGKAHFLFYEQDCSTASERHIRRGEATLRYGTTTVAAPQSVFGRGQH
jgi:hypothetical protein